jgi:cellulose synthase/poly-beta-1,6-N-acetylglucosamine synthase-like glycosyltransferase
MKDKKVSIIIPLYWSFQKKHIGRFLADFKNYTEQSYRNFEVLLVCDKKVYLPISYDHRIKFIYTKANHTTSPAEKRDFALRYAKGTFCAFIDDDAYPDRNWLKRAVVHFKDPNIIAVGGPGVTPQTDRFWQKIGGYIIESYLCSGGIQLRFYPGKMCFVEDYPAYNLIVRTSVLKKVGGYGSTYYGGEDTLLCLKIIKYGKILYDPKVVVFHHRRSFPISHLKQIKGVAIHRGYFFKAYPETSRLPFYLLPTALTLGFFGTIVLSCLYPKIFLVPTVILFSLFWSLGAASIKSHNLDLTKSIIGGFGVIITHLTYGIFFLIGLLKRDLKR